MNKKQEIEMMEALFWQQFPEGTKESTLSVERNVLQALWGKGEKSPFGKILQLYWNCRRSYLASYLQYL